MKHSSKRKPGLILVGVLLIFIIGGVTGWLPLHKVAGGVLSPLGNFLNKGGARLSNAFREFSQLGSLNKQKDELQAENLDLNFRLSQLSELEAENSQLRAQLGYAARSKISTVGAEVIGFQPDGIRQFVRINRGESDGIRKGAAVLDGGALVGKISEANSNSAVVMLVNDPDFRVLVSSQDGKTTGIVKGQPGGAVIMERIQKNQNLKAGDIIITSGLDGEFPRGLIVGKVETINESSDGIFLVASIAPASDLSRVRLVQVAKP